MIPRPLARLGEGLTTHRRIAGWIWRFGSCRHLRVHVRGIRRARTRKRWRGQSFSVERIKPAVSLALLVVLAWAAVCLLISR